MSSRAILLSRSPMFSKRRGRHEIIQELRELADGNDLTPTFAAIDKSQSGSETFNSADANEIEDFLWMKEAFRALNLDSQGLVNRQQLGRAFSRDHDLAIHFSSLPKRYRSGRTFEQFIDDVVSHDGGKKVSLEEVISHLDPGSSASVQES